MLKAQLSALGVEDGDTLMLHASMRAVGGRAEDLLRAIQEAVGPGGRLLMLICAEEGVPFDPQTSKAWHELGVLAEVFRTWPGVGLNEHPIARMGAWGEGAAELVRAPPLDDYYGPGSPLERLWEARGKVLRLGADTNSTTLLHYADYLVPLTGKRRATRRAETVRGPVSVSCLDDDDGIFDWLPGEDYFAGILEAFLESGGGRSGPVGAASCDLLPARELCAFGEAWMLQNLKASRLA